MSIDKGTVKEEIAELRKRLDKLEQRIDPLPDYVGSGTVIRFQKRFTSTSSGRYNNDYYTYVALKVGVRNWYLTGIKVDLRIMTDKQFREFIADDKVTKIERATEWERLGE